MKKLILTITAVAGASLTAFAQGQVGFANADANGYVVTSSLPDTSSSAAGTYALAASFTTELWALPSPTSTTGGLSGLDAYGFLNPINLTSDGFSEVTSVGNVAGVEGSFSAALNAIIPGTTSGNTVLAVVAWTGAATTFAEALAAYQNGTGYLGILAFVNPVGPASPTPYSGDISTGWNLLQNSPRTAAVGGITGSTEDLILTTVPEPTTMAMAALGGLSLLALRRKK